MSRKFSVIVAALASAVMAIGIAGIAQAHGDKEERVYGKPGDAGKPARIVQVVMGEAEGRMHFIPSRIAIRKGEQIRFMLRNNGQLDHEFVVATVAENLAHMKAMEQHPDMEHDDPNARRLKPGKTAEFVWHFTQAGSFDFSCLIPGHRPSGMTGTIVVE